MDLYVYYRARHADGQTVERQVGALQQQLRDQYGVRCGLKQRPRLKEELITWMEIYLAVPGNFQATLERAVAASPLPLLIDGERHVEYFLDCLPCA